MNDRRRKGCGGTVGRGRWRRTATIRTPSLRCGLLAGPRSRLWALPRPCPDAQSQAPPVARLHTIAPEQLRPSLSLSPSVSSSHLHSLGADSRAEAQAADRETHSVSQGLSVSLSQQSLCSLLLLLGYRRLYWPDRTTGTHCVVHWTCRWLYSYRHREWVVM